MGGITSAVGDLFGGAKNNAGFSASGTNVVSPVTKEQATAAYDQQQRALAQQQALAQQLGAQGGLQNQGQVAGILQGLAQGQGPNPAQMMLNQSTGQNVANQAALMAGQRGAGANVGLMARQAAQQGAGIQQQAGGQAATMGAQQQLAATGQLGNLAQQQIANQMQAQQGYGNQSLAEQQALLNSIAGVNQANVGMQGNLNSTNAAMAQTNATNTANAIGGLTSGLGAAIGMASGGIIPDLHETSKIYHGYACGGMAQGGVLNGEAQAQTQEPVPGKAKVSGDSPKNDTVPAKLSPGELIIPRSVMESEDPVKEGTKFLVEALKKQGHGKEKDDFKEALTKAATKRKA